MVMVEGISAKGHELSGRQLLSAWRKVSDRPLPKVKAFQLHASDFNSILRTQKCLDNEIREVEEWGRILSFKGTDACVFNTDEPGVDYIIIVRNNPYHTLKEILVHELSHIAAGDL